MTILVGNQAAGGASSGGIPNPVTLLDGEMTRYNITSGEMEGSGDINTDAEVTFTPKTVISGAGSLQLKEIHRISSGGENVFFKNLASGINYVPAWVGIKDQSIVANQDATGLVLGSHREYDEIMLSIEQGGVISATNITGYDDSVTIAENISVYGVRFRLGEALSVGNILHYAVFLGTDNTDENQIVQVDETVSSAYSAGDFYDLWFRSPAETFGGVTTFAQIILETELGSGVESTLQVYAVDTDPNEHYAIVHLREFVDTQLPTQVQIDKLDDAVLNADTSTAAMQFVIDEESMVSNSPTKVPTQKSVKTYVDNLVTSGMTYKGGYDATNNLPNLEIAPTGMVVGDFFTVTAAGTFFSVDVEIGDALIAEVNDPTAETEWTILLRHLDAVAIKALNESNPNTNAFEDLDEAKLDGIAEGATANSTDAFLLDRVNHTGTQTASTISDFDTEVSSNTSVTTNSSKVSFPEAPADGKQYARKDVAWIEVVAGSGDMLSANNLSDVADKPTSRTNMNVDIAGTDNSTNVSLGGVPSDVTDDTLDLVGQILTVNAVTQSTDGAMIAADKLKLDNLSGNGAGDSWVSGLDVTEHSPKNQTVDYTAGTYLIDGVMKTIAIGGVYDLENGFGSVDHYSDLTSYQHRFVSLYVDTDEVIKSVGGVAAEKKEVPPLPTTPIDSVTIALIEVKVDNSAVPKDIKNKEITDTRNTPAFNTDEFVRISADDLGVGHLRDKLTDNGNVVFTIENPAGIETMKAAVDIASDSAVAANTSKNSYPSGDAAKLSGIEALAEVNNISDTNATDLTDGGETTLHSHAAPVGTYGDIHRSSIGNQKIKNANEVLAFNSSGVYNGVITNATTYRLTVPTTGDYRIVFSGSAQIKKDVLYSFSVKVNASTFSTLGNIESASDNYLRTFSYEMGLLLTAGDFVQISAITDNSQDKDFFLQIGTSFSIVKL